MQFKAEFTETLQRVITIEADSEDEALDKANEMYRNEEVVLDSSDMMDGAEILVTKL